MAVDSFIGCEPGAAISNPENFYNQAIGGMLGPALAAAAKSLSKEEFIRRHHQGFLHRLEVDTMEADPKYREAQERIRQAKTRHRGDH